MKNKIVKPKKSVPKKVKVTFDFQKWLEEIGACGESRKWACGFKSPHAAWLACENPYWMFTAIQKAPPTWSVPVKSIHLCALEIAGLQECPDKYWPKGWTHRRCLEVIRNAIVMGDNSELAAAGAVAGAAGAAAGAVWAAAEAAAEAAVRAARAAGWAAGAAVRAAVRAAAGAAGAAAEAAVRAAAEKTICDLIRKHIELPKL